MVVLQAANCTYEIAKNGFEAVELCLDKKNKFDAILMDINMPIMDGIEATKMIRKNSIRGASGNSDVFIVGLSASNEEKDVTNALVAGMDDYVIKGDTNIYKLILEKINAANKDNSQHVPEKM